MPTVTLKVTPRFQRQVFSAVYSKILAGFFKDILGGIVVNTVAAQIISNAGPATSAFLEAFQPKIIGSSWQILLGSVTELNKHTGMGGKREAANQWRYGWWFNVEFGREYPRRGKGWVFQQVPGAAAGFPGSPTDRPPGATPEEMRAGLALAYGNPGVGGVLTGTKRLNLHVKSTEDADNAARHLRRHRSMVLERAGVRQTRGVAEWKAALKHAGYDRDAILQHTRRLPSAKRVEKLKAARQDLVFQSGQRALAPIRRGYAEGLEISYGRLAGAFQKVVDNARAAGPGAL